MYISLCYSIYRVYFCEWNNSINKCIFNSDRDCQNPTVITLSLSVYVRFFFSLDNVEKKNYWQSEGWKLYFSLMYIFWLLRKPSIFSMVFQKCVADIFFESWVYSLALHITSFGVIFIFLSMVFCHYASTFFSSLEWHSCPETINIYCFWANTYFMVWISLLSVCSFIWDLFLLC